MDSLHLNLPEEVRRTSAEVSSLIARARDLGEQAVNQLFNPSDLLDLDLKVFGGYICQKSDVETLPATSLTD